jgi:hypothetical protein
MFCGECGTQNPDTNRFCINCGKPLKKNLNVAPVAHPAPASAPLPVPQAVQLPPKPVSQQSFPVPPPGTTVPQAPTAAPVPVPQAAQQPPKPVSQQSFPVPPPGITVPQEPATTTLSAAPLEKSHRNWLAIISFILALVSWVIYPIIIGFFAMGLGIFSLYTAKKGQSKIPVIAVIAIIIGLLAIVLNFFWLDIFPAPAILPPII